MALEPDPVKASFIARRATVALSRCAVAYGAPLAPPGAEDAPALAQAYAECEPRRLAVLDCALRALALSCDVRPRSYPTPHPLTLFHSTPCESA